MNHLGDANKMVDTPRMDASAHDDGAIWETGCDIERELNAANYEVQHLREAYIQLQEGNERQRQRIKRLEEAGDEAICPLEYAARVRIWTQAKEAKL